MAINTFHVRASIFLVIAIGIFPFFAKCGDIPDRAKIEYTLPPADKVSKTWRVTLAIVDHDNPDWIVSQFVRGDVRTVTKENGGHFQETWDGLDDNHMPAPPGHYGVKGIYMPASQWVVDGEYHTITPRFVGGASSWLPTPDQWKTPEPFGGDPVGSPIGAVAVGPNGHAVFYYSYLENGLNCPTFDLNKPLVNLDQFIRAYPSGGAAGGDSVATDGNLIWAYSTDGGPKFVFRADQKSFGNDAGANRNHVYRPKGWVTGMVAGPAAEAGKSHVYVAQRGKFIEFKSRQFIESDRDFADILTIHDGETGAIRAEIPLNRPRGLALRNGSLYALHEEAGKPIISQLKLDNGLPAGQWQRMLTLPANLSPFDLAIDSQHRFYVSDPASNHVYQFDAAGRQSLVFGKLNEQVAGAYDRFSLMSPGRLALWTDSAGKERLIIVEQAGPNRVAEWSLDGQLLREFPTLQTKANDGYAFDPSDPSTIYIAGQKNWLTRYHVDYATGKFDVEAVWPNVGNDPLAPGFDHPQFIRVSGREYLACGRSNQIYRHEGNRWLLSAAIIRERIGNKSTFYLWRDEAGNGKIDPADVHKHPLDTPGWLIRYHGNQWGEDLCLLAINQGGQDVWKLSPTGFDQHGNPIFSDWHKVFTDSIFEARAAGKADATHGGNELAQSFSSDWAMVDGMPAEGYYIVARGGPNFSANDGAQTKVSRYVHDGHGGYRMQWRTGRQAMQQLAEPGDMYGAIHIRRPINGLLSVIDQSRCGVLLYTEDGLYVDTLFPDSRRFTPTAAGVYPQPGEFFAGSIIPNQKNGKIYVALGKYTPMIYEAQGWSLTQNEVKPIATIQKTVDISASQISAPPEIALSVRGGAGAARVARFAPALGGAKLDGALDGWESCLPVNFSSSKDHTVEVRCMYDPRHLYFRWHARLGSKFVARPLAPAERIFTHERLADTLSVYLQCDQQAKPSKDRAGRPGDVRFVFGLLDDHGSLKPTVVGMYPKWTGKGPASPFTSATPVGRVAFEHVGVIKEIELGGKLDADGQGFVIAAALPLSALPGALEPSGSLRTLANFSATFGGHDKFWWANRDGSANHETYDEPSEAALYPGSWAPADFTGLGDGVTIRNWLICGPFGGPGAERFVPDPRDKMKDEVRKFSLAAAYPPDDQHVDLTATYTGARIQGYWNDPHKISWKPATIADLDSRVILGPAAQTWYGVAWVHADKACEVDFEIQSHPQTDLRYFLNGNLVHSGEIKSEKRPPTTSKKVSLKQGWNQVCFRGFCYGYAPFRAGLIVKAPESTLWQLQFRATPPG